MVRDKLVLSPTGPLGLGEGVGTLRDRHPFRRWDVTRRKQSELSPSSFPHFNTETKLRCASQTTENTKKELNEGTTLKTVEIEDTPFDRFASKTLHLTRPRHDGHTTGRHTHRHLVNYTSYSFGPQPEAPCVPSRPSSASPSWRTEQRATLVTSP